MTTHNFSIQQVKQMDMVEYLKKLGYQPQKIRDQDYWYLSPLRKERTPSFKINRKLNAWFDHGSGRGGNLIDFSILYHNCNIKELMKKINDPFYFHQQSLVVHGYKVAPQDPQNTFESKIKIIAIKPLTSPLLFSYLKDRKISFSIAKNYCKEISFSLNGRSYFAIGFKNNSGGFELRNPGFKGSSSPKDVTMINNCSKELVVIEGFFSFLSYLTLQEKDISLTNFLVLNSLSFFEKSRPGMEKHQVINLYLDRDPAGIKNTQRALLWDKRYFDQSRQFKNCKDLNDYLINQRLEEKKRQWIGQTF